MSRSASRAAPNARDAAMKIAELCFSILSVLRLRAQVHQFPPNRVIDPLTSELEEVLLSGGHRIDEIVPRLRAAGASPYCDESGWCRSYSAMEAAIHLAKQ